MLLASDPWAALRTAVGFFFSVDQSDSPPSAEPALGVLF